jgi:acyl-CoA synthetase (AMP-forming)/AMP-acid ligase II
MLLGDVLRTATDQAPDQRALVFGAAALTYRELGQQSERIAGSLRRAGVGHGDRVVLFFGNRPELILGYFACFRLGAYKVPERIEILAELPLDPVGKVDRHALQERAWAERGR